MKLKPLYILFSSVFLLTGCRSADTFKPTVIQSENVQEELKTLTNKGLLEKYKKKKPKETISNFINLEMDQDYKGEEIFVHSYTKEKEIFRVLSFDEEKNKFKTLFKKETKYDENNPYFIDGVLPFVNNKTQHILIGKHLNPGMHYHFFLIGKTTGKDRIDILIDNALKEKAKPISNGSVAIGPDAFSILENGLFVDEYSQTETGYKTLKGSIK